MTQNGPYPGQPSQPWSAEGSDDSYQEPADPWGDHQHDAWGGNPTSTPPGAGGSPADYGLTGSGYVPAPPYTSAPDPSSPGVSAPGMAPGWAPGPVPPRRRGPGAPIVALVVVLGLLICGGLGTTAWLLIQRSNENATAGAATPTPTVARTTAAELPRPQDSQNARFVTKGQCVRNEGTADAPQMTIVPCTNGTYEVLARVDGRTTGEADAETKCAKVRQYTKWYFYDSELDSLDFVLCLRER